MIVHTFNPSSRGEEGGGPLCVQNQSGLRSDTLSKKKIKNEDELGKLNCEGPERPFRDLVLTLKLEPMKDFKHKVTKSGFFFKLSKEQV